MYYEQKTGNLLNSSHGYLVRGYSGYSEGLNNPDLEMVVKYGPIPKGTYSLLTAIHDRHMGQACIPLLPFPSNKMFNRTEFYIHGDNKEMNFTASRGCIILALKDRLNIIFGSDRFIQVI